MNCEKTALLMTEKLAGEISPENDALLQKHLESCEACRKEFAELEKIWKLTEETLKEEAFHDSLDFTHYGKITKTAKREGNIFYRHRLRIFEFAAAFFIVLILYGLFLPAGSKCKLARSSIEVKMQAIEDKGLSGPGNPTISVDMKELDKIPEPPAPPEEVVEDFEVEVNGQNVGKIKVYSETVDSSKKKQKQSEPMSSANIEPPSPEQEVNIPGLVEIKPNVSRLKIEPVNPAKIIRGLPSIKKYSSGGAKYREETSDKDAEGLPDMGPPAPEIKTDVPTCPVPAIQSVEADKFKKECTSEIKATRTYSTAAKRKLNIDEIQPQEEMKFAEEPRMIFSTKVNLRRWDLTTQEDVTRFLTQHGISCKNTEIQVHSNTDALTITIPEKEYKKLKDVFENLKKEDEKLKENKDGLPYIKTETKPVSTFSIDVDTASYTAARKRIQRGERPLPTSVRAEEFINYFDYHYPSPRGTTFGIYLQAAPSPVRTSTYIMRIGVQGKKLGPGEKTKSAYTILVDTSGSMAEKGRLELVKKSIELFVSQLKPDDQVSLIFCGDTLERPVNNMKVSNPAFKKAVAEISASGPTELAKGIEAAYATALKNYVPGANNKVVMFSDGIFDPGQKDKTQIIKTVEDARTKGVSNIMIALGGDGDDNLMEEIADKGDGSYVFIDSEDEAMEIFQKQFAARFREIAKDVKIQVEFNPEFVESYRQIGYDNRQLSRADFRNDKVDAGEVGSGQSVTALYELKLKTEPGKIKSPAATVRIRYKNMPSLEIEEREYYLEDKDFATSFNDAEASLKLAFAVGEFAEFLKYPDVPRIATPRLIGDIVKSIRGSTYSSDNKVEELYNLINSVK